MATLYPRSWKLVVYNQNQILDVSNLRFTFSMTAADVETPNTMLVRIYNVSETPQKPTAEQIQREFTRINLQVGYGQDIGVIFDGTIRQVRLGRENQVDTYLDIVAGDGDEFYNYGLINTTLPAGANGAKAQYDAIVQQTNKTIGSDPNNNQFLTGGTTPLPRGKVMWGMAKNPMRDLAKTNGWSWSIQDGQIKIIPYTLYPEGTAVVINSATGMIGLPTQTIDGIICRSLINHKIKPGTVIQINEKSIQLAQRTLVRSQGTMDETQWESVTRLANVTRDGFYRVYAIDYAGDTRGNDWYMDITALSIDQDTKLVPAGAGIERGAQVGTFELLP